MVILLSGQCINPAFYSITNQQSRQGSVKNILIHFLVGIYYAK